MTQGTKDVENDCTRPMATLRAYLPAQSGHGILGWKKERQIYGKEVGRVECI